MNAPWLTYNDLVEQYGQDNASEILQTIEQLAETTNKWKSMNGEIRLRMALEALNDNDHVTKH